MHAREDLSTFSTIGNLMGTRLSSLRLARLCEFITIGGFSAFLLVEMIIGAQIFSSAFPEFVGAEYAGFIVMAAVVLAYIWIGGYLATVESDSWQFRLAITGGVALLMVSIVVLYSSFGGVERSSATGLPSQSFQYWGQIPALNLVVWIVYVSALNLFYPLGQLGQWQRTASSISEERSSGLLRGVILQGAFWGLFLTCALMFSMSGISVGTWGDVFAEAVTLGGFMQQVVYPLLFAGLVAAVISTADSSAMAILFSVFSGRAFKGINYKDEWSIVKTQKSKILSVLFAVLFVFFVIYQEFGLQGTLINLIFSLFGLFLILAPATAHVIINGGQQRLVEHYVYYSLIAATVVLGILIAFGLYNDDFFYIHWGTITSGAIAWFGVILSKSKVPAY